MAVGPWHNPGACASLLEPIPYEGMSCSAHGGWGWGEEACSCPNLMCKTVSTPMEPLPMRSGWMEGGKRSGGWDGRVGGGKSRGGRED